MKQVISIGVSLLCIGFLSACATVDEVGDNQVKRQAHEGLTGPGVGVHKGSGAVAEVFRYKQVF